MATILVAVNAQAHVSAATLISVRLGVYCTLGFTVASGVHYLVTLQTRAGQEASNEAGTQSGNPKDD